MSTSEGAIAPDVSGSVAPPGGSPADSSPAPATPTTDSQSSADVQPQSVQESGPEAVDPLAGLPSVEELKAQAEQGVEQASGLANLRSAYEALKPQYDQIQERFKVFEPIADRFESSEQLQQLVDMQEKLYGFTNDPESGQLVPTTAPFVEALPMDRADDLAVELLNRPTLDPGTGQQVRRMDLILDDLAADPAKRAYVARKFGLVEPSAVAPSWAPTPEELEVVRPELQQYYKERHVDEREYLRDM